MNRSQNNRPKPKERAYSDGETLYSEKALKNKRNKRFVRFITVCFALVIATVLLFFAAKALFKVESFNVEGNSYYTAEQISEACGIDKGRFMFGFSAFDVEQRIERKCPYIEEVKVVRDYPSTVNIYVKELSACYYTSVVGKYIVISSELKVLEVSDENKYTDSLIFFELPHISVAIEGQSIEFSATEKVDYILEFIKALSEYSSEYKITRADLRESHSIKLYCGEGYEVQLGKSDEMQLKLRTLSSILASDKLKSHKYAKIDMTDPKEPSFVPIDVE